MFKHFIIYSIVFLMLVSTVQAQEERPLSKWYSEAAFGMGGPSFNKADTYLSTWDMNVGFGYNLSPRFALKAPLALSWNLFKNSENGTTSYQVDGQIGVAAGYYLGNTQQWQLTAEFGHNLPEKPDEWNHFYYDVGGKYYFDSPRDNVGFMALSLRQYISGIKGTPNYFMLCLTIGFKSNWERRR